MAMDERTSFSQEKADCENKEHENNADELKGVSDELKEQYLTFMAKDAEWHSFMIKKLLYKVDLRMIPLLSVMYLLNMLDRSNLAQARLGSLEADLNMTGTNFNLATSILFVGYLLMQLPSNMIITRVRPSLFIGSAMVVWGTVSACQAAVTSFGGLLACRLMLGFVEAPFFSGAIMLMSSWYTRNELAHRISWFYSGCSVANMFGGLLGAAVLGNMDGAHGIEGWRWLFIIEGSITIGVALFSMVFLADMPSKERWLTPEERSYAIWRLIKDTKESDDSAAVSLWEGLKLAVKDVRLYLFILLQHLGILTQTFQYFFPSIVQTLGYGKIATLLLTAPAWFATFIVALAVTYTSGKYQDRCYHICGLIMISFVGNIIASTTTGTGPRMFAMFLMPIGTIASYQIILAWVANTFPRPQVKRSICIAICNMIANTGNIYGSYMYPSTAAPRYLAGGIAVCVMCLAIVVLAFIIRLILQRDNKLLEKKELEGTLEGQEESNDSRAKGFRYVL
ncbi:major facilitator superfamily domain-containing protein [Dipodascopsis uninucleata]